MELHVINTGYFKLDGGAMFGVVPKTIWNKLNPADENNLCNWAMRCLLIQDGKRLILVDTGIGDKQDEKFLKHYYLNGDDTLIGSILKAGFSPDDVTDVILTHLHFDHCGGATRVEKGKIVPTFKNAAYWVHKDHWNWAINPNQREKASFLKENLFPIQESGQLQFISSESAISNISFFYADGHTEKQLIPIIQNKNQKIAFVADLIPSRFHLKTNYVMGYDIRPLLSMDEKQRFLNQASMENFILFFEHDPTIETALTYQEGGEIKFEFNSINF